MALPSTVLSACLLNVLVHPGTWLGSHSTTSWQRDFEEGGRMYFYLVGCCLSFLVILLILLVICLERQDEQDYHAECPCSNYAEIAGVTPHAVLQSISQPNRGRGGRWTESPPAYSTLDTAKWM